MGTFLSNLLGMTHTKRLSEERLAEEIVALAEDLGVRLIIVGRRNRELIRRALAGSVSDSVVRHAHRPILVVPSHKAADNPP